MTTRKLWFLKQLVWNLLNPESKKLGILFQTSGDLSMLLCELFLIENGPKDIAGSDLAGLSW